LFGDGCRRGYAIEKLVREPHVLQLASFRHCVAKSRNFLPHLLASSLLLQQSSQPRRSAKLEQERLQTARLLDRLAELNANAVTLARGLRAALSEMRVSGAPRMTR
jgi:hypothetical protein